MAVPVSGTNEPWKNHANPVSAREGGGNDYSHYGPQDLLTLHLGSIEAPGLREADGIVPPAGRACGDPFNYYWIDWSRWGPNPTDYGCDQENVFQGFLFSDYDLWDVDINGDAVLRCPTSELINGWVSESYNDWENLNMYGPRTIPPWSCHCGLGCGGGGSLEIPEPCTP